MLCYCTEGELEVSQRDRILGIIGAGKAFGELAVLYNCQRTASVRGRFATFHYLMLRSFCAPEVRLYVMWHVSTV